MTWRSLAESRQPCRCSEAQPWSSWWPRTPRPRCNIGTNNCLVTQIVDVARFTNPKAPITNFDRFYSVAILPAADLKYHQLRTYVHFFFTLDFWFYMSPRYALLYPITRCHIWKGTNILCHRRKKPSFFFLQCLCRFSSPKISQNHYVDVVDDMGWKPLSEMVWCLHRSISAFLYKSSLPAKFGKQLIDL